MTLMMIKAPAEVLLHNDLRKLAPSKPRKMDPETWYSRTGLQCHWSALPVIVPVSPSFYSRLY